ncbi:MAG: hypothetical protein ED557_09230 [Balneola sp.]|nr:MAG: hypothetical protein ED557_09230 [Balneola sp.]
MKVTYYLLFLLILVSCKSSEEFLDNTPEIDLFNYAYFNQEDSLVLGKTIIGLTELGNSYDAQSIRIPISYPGVESITTFFSKDSIITDLLFTYQSTFEFKGTLKGYIDDFGKPEVVESDDLITYKWRDQKTKFDVLSSFSNGDTLNYSILSLSNSNRFQTRSYEYLKKFRKDPDMYDLLATSKIWSIIGGIDEGLKMGVSSFVEVEDSSRIFDLIKANFKDIALFSYSKKYLDENISEIEFEGISEFLFEEWFSEVQYRMDDYTPELSIEEYAATLENSPPEQLRVLTILRFVRANNAGSFFLELEEANARSVERIRASIEGNEISSTAMSVAERQQKIQQYEFGTAVSFLWALEILSNDEINRISELYESSFGKLYVDSYSKSLVFAYEKATDKLIEEIENKN